MSILSFPDRGPWGNAQWRGNCSGHIYRELYQNFRPKDVVEVFSGLGTAKQVADELSIPIVALAPIMWAVADEEASLAVVQVLLASGADVNASTDRGETALLEAVSGNAPLEVIQELLNAGADPNTQSTFGTPLHAAAEHSKSPLVFNALIAAGADPAITDYRGRNAWDLAAGNPALSQLAPDSNWHLDAYYQLVHTMYGHLGVVIGPCVLDDPRQVCGTTSSSFDFFRASWDYFVTYEVDTPSFFKPREAWKVVDDSYARLYDWNGGRTFLVMYSNGDILIDLVDR